MNLGGLILGVPIFGAATLALWWVTRRIPAGRKGLAVGSGALLAIPLVAFVTWFGALQALTTATYVCVDCGRTEEQERFLFVPLTREVCADGEDYVRRFSANASHAHRWHLDGCIRRAGGVSCTEQYVEGWFRVLPKLKDRAAADTLYHEARGLPEERRIGLMQEVSDRVWMGSLPEDDFDGAFAKWRAHRK